MKKTFLILFIFISALPFLVSAQSLCYKMASFEPESRTVQRTPLFDIRIFGSEDGCFPIAKKGEVAGNQYQLGIQFLFDLIIGTCIALAVLLFTFGAAVGIIFDKEGGLGISGNFESGGYADTIFNKVGGKKIMQNSIIGLLVVLGMWLVVNTVNPDLLRLPALQDLSKLQTESGSSPASTVRGTSR